ncbi:MAG TPA: dihydrodipicolinate synthase family protein [Solirubrobacterales bacterium]|nr:dihydrodipicolinate synthase family protein [Solirubrobacterales bacterium]
MAELELPVAGGSLQRFRFSPPPDLPAPSGKPARSRVCFAAAHVVADPLADSDPVDDPGIDWEATLAFRRHLWRHGLGVAEAMDTAQRGMGLGWEAARELIARSAAEARASGGRIACGAGTDQLEPGMVHSLETIREAYLEQCRFVADHGATVVVMASRALAAAAAGPGDYRAVYDAVLAEAAEPVILHWLGEAFDPALAGYWGDADPERAGDLLLELIADHAARIDGVKVSVLDDALELSLRRRLPEGVRVYTGDDFNYPRLIRGDGDGHSDALLGILDGIAPVAAAALDALDAGELDRYDELLTPTLPFSRHVFAAPTRHYKTGLVFLAYLNGHQSHFRMVGGLEGARSIRHLAELIRLADAAGLLRDPELAAARARHALALAGVGEM